MRAVWTERQIAQLEAYCEAGDMTIKQMARKLRMPLRVVTWQRRKLGHAKPLHPHAVAVVDRRTVVKPCQAMPGTLDRKMVFAKRAAAGLPLFSPHDARPNLV